MSKLLLGESGFQHISVASFRLFKDQIAPVYAPDPPDEEPSSEQLNEANNNGVNAKAVLVQAAADHSANAREEYVDDEDDDVQRFVNTMHRFRFNFRTDTHLF